MLVVVIVEPPVVTVVVTTEDAVVEAEQPDHEVHGAEVDQGPQRGLAAAPLNQPAGGFFKEGKADHEEEGRDELDGDGEAPSDINAVRARPKGDAIANPALRLLIFSTA